jgi:hypothetical protein
MFRTAGIEPASSAGEVTVAFATGENYKIKRRIEIRRQEKRYGD